MESDREQNEFNMAVSYLNRLNSAFYAADNAALELNAHEWYHSLRVLFRELSTEMKKDEITTWKNNLNSINTKVVQQINTNQRKQTMSIEPSLYQELEECEMFLRRILKESGLQGKMRMDPRKALG